MLELQDLQLSATSFAAEHAAIVAAITIALFIFARFGCTPTCTFNRSRVETLRQRHRLPKWPSTKLARI